MRSAPTLAQLRAFVAVVDHASFSDAANALGVSQPTLSQSLAALERGIGRPLVERTPKRVLITADGRELLPLARSTVEAAEAFRAAAIPDTWLTGPLHLGVIPTVAPYLLPALLATLGRETPDLQLFVHEDQTDRLLESLADGAIDVTIVALPIRDQRVVAHHLYIEDFVLAVPAKHEWAGAKGISLSQLADQDLLFLEEGHCLRDQTIEVCLQSGVANAGDASARAASLSTIVQLVAAGLGTTFLPASAVKVETRGALIDVATFESPTPGRTIALVHRRTSARAEEFEDLAEILRRAARKMPGVRPDDVHA